MRSGRKDSGGNKGKGMKGSLITYVIILPDDVKGTLAVD